MPNTQVPAAAEGMSKFNKAKVMRDAWTIYRTRWAGARPATEQARRKQFAMALKNAWAWAKELAMEALKSVSEKAADRARELASELMRLDAQPWGMRSHNSAAGRAAIIADITNFNRIASDRKRP